MLFHSSEFFLFFLVFLCGFALFRGHARVVYVTIASFIFYGRWNPVYLPLLLGLSLYAYYFALRPKLSPAAFRWVLAGALLPLFIFKYAGFAAANMAWMFGASKIAVGGWALPLGISFITFTVISYLVDVRQGTAEAEKGFWRFFLYLSFFPHLIAGPIMRAKELLPQLKHLMFKPKLVKLGVLLFAVGMVKKMVVADPLSHWVDVYYGAAGVRDLPHALLAFYAFPVQIYCDFSGYVDMALGSAFILGIRLPLNFNRPYLACSIREFWRRWHITLSRWLRDYLYIPMGGSSHGFARTALALLATMFLGGLWHGASWTFVVWGGLHALLMITEHAAGRFLKFRLPDILRRFWTFHAVAVLWIFFRAPNWQSLGGLFGGFSASGSWDFFYTEAAFPILLIVAALALHFRDKVSFVAWMARRLPAVSVYAVSLALILLCKVIAVGNPSAFIYFDF